MNQELYLFDHTIEFEWLQNSQYTEIEGSQDLKKPFVVTASPQFRSNPISRRCIQTDGFELQEFVYRDHCRAILALDNQLWIESFFLNDAEIKSQYSFPGSNLVENEDGCTSALNEAGRIDFRYWMSNTPDLSLVRDCVTKFQSNKNSLAFFAKGRGKLLRAFTANLDGFPLTEVNFYVEENDCYAIRHEFGDTTYFIFYPESARSYKFRGSDDIPRDARLFVLRLVKENVDAFWAVVEDNVKLFSCADDLVPEISPKRGIQLNLNSPESMHRLLAEMSRLEHRIFLEMDLAKINLENRLMTEMVILFDGAVANISKNLLKTIFSAPRVQAHNTLRKIMQWSKRTRLVLRLIYFIGAIVSIGLVMSALTVLLSRYF